MLESQPNAPNNNNLFEITESIQISPMPIRIISAQSNFHNQILYLIANSPELKHALAAVLSRQYYTCEVLSLMSKANIQGCSHMQLVVFMDLCQ